MNATLLWLCCLLSNPNYHGATISFYGEGIHGVQSYTDILKSLADSGAQSVSFVMPWRVEHINANSVKPNPDQQERDRTLAKMVKRAHTHGLTVMLMPIVILDKAEPGEWRGRLQPKDRPVFWASYNEFIKRYAVFAHVHSVDLFVVGSELASLEIDKAQWVALIAEVRRRFSGALTYSANWDHFEHVSFWDYLDFIGISGYFELTEDPKASFEALRAAWAKIRVVLVDRSQELKRPLLFTELGYPSLDGGAVKPWDYTQSTEIDLEEQALAFRAFREVWMNESLLCGVYFWNWWGPIDGRNRWYTIPGKPSHKEVKAYFEVRLRLQARQKKVCMRRTSR